MRSLPAAALIACVAFSFTLYAGILPTFHLEPATLQVFEAYVAQFERNILTPWAETGKLPMDADTHSTAYTAGKPVLRPRENTDIANGSIHHFSGVLRVPGAAIADVRHIMQDYANYPKYFKGDVAKGSGAPDSGSSPADEHYTSRLSLVQSTLWIAVSYDCDYDTHYRLYDSRRWASLSHSNWIHEWRDPKDESRGYYPDGDDHGFLWKTNTYWFVREDNAGIDIELDSMTLSRPVPTGFAWWGTKRTHDAVEKMLKDMKSAVDALHQPRT